MIENTVNTYTFLAPFDLEDRYGQLYPVEMADGTVELYDESGELVAELSPEGEVTVLCEDEAEVAQCDPMTQSCPDLPLEDQYAYNEDEPWLDECVDESLVNQAKNFSEDVEVFTKKPKAKKSETQETEEPIGGPIDKPLMAESEEQKAAEEIPPAYVPEEEKVAAAADVKGEKVGQSLLVEKEDAPASQPAPEAPVSEEPQQACALQGDISGDWEMGGGLQGAPKACVAAGPDSELDTWSDNGVRVARSVKAVVQNALDSAQRFIEDNIVDEDSRRSWAEIARGLRSWVRGMLSGAGGRTILASAEDGSFNTAVSPESGRSAERARVSRRDSSVSATAARNGRTSGNNPLAAGGMAMYDANSDPDAIAFAQAGLGGQPHNEVVAKDGSEVIIVHRKMRHDRVLAASSQGDANDRQGKQDGNDTGSYEMFEFVENASQSEIV